MSKDVLVKEVMKTKPVIVQPYTTVFEAACLMREKKIGNVLIAELRHPIGILTESDIIKKVVSEGKNPKDVQVEEVMSGPLVVADPYITLQEALKIMGRNNIRRLPIIENNEMVGIITQRDISRISPTLFEIAHEWSTIDRKAEPDMQAQIFSGKCEDCTALSTRLKNVDGRLLCEDCIDGLKYTEG